MSPLKAWFAVSFALAFAAGGGAALVVDRLAGTAPAATPDRDADAYVRTFEEQIGVESDAQRRALRAAFERRLTDLRSVTQRLVAENREAFHRVDREFVERVAQILGPEQRLRWRERTGAVGEGGPADSDAGDGGTPAGGTGGTGGREEK